MKARTRLACTLAMLAPLLLASEANAQWGRGWGRCPGWGAGYGHGWGYGSGWRGRGWGAWGPQSSGCLLGPRMACWLGLTRAQQDAIDDLHLKAVDGARSLWQELDRTEFELSVLTTAPKYDEKAATGLRKKARELDAKLDDVWSKYQRQVFALLTPEQRQDYDRVVAARGPYGCPSHGPGYGLGGGRYLRWGRGYWGGRGGGYPPMK